MRTVLFSFMMAMLCFSCKKSDDGGNSSIMGDGQFRVDNTSFTALSVQGSSAGGTGVMSAAGNNGTKIGSFTLTFTKGLPTASGTMNIVAPGATTTTNSVYIMTGSRDGFSSPQTAYASTNSSSNPTATITMVNGKVKVVISDLTVTNDDGSTSTASCNLTQQ